MEDDSTSFLNLFKHKSAIDPRLARSSSLVEDSSSSGEGEGEEGKGENEWRSDRPSNKRTAATTTRSRSRLSKSNGANGVNVKRSKSDLQPTTTSKSLKSGSQQQPFTLDDDDDDDNDRLLHAGQTKASSTTNIKSPLSPSSSPSSLPSPSPTYPLPSYLANALQSVTQNKKLRAQLHSSVDSTTQNTNVLPPSSKNRISIRSSGPPAPEHVYSIDDDDDDESDSNSITKPANSIPSTTRTSTHTHSVSQSSPNTNSTSVLLSVYSSATDPQPVKFRYLKAEAFVKLLNTFCKFKKIDTASAGIKWYGISLDLNQTPQDYEMTDEENLYYYNKNGPAAADGSEPAGNTSKNDDIASSLASVDPAPSENVPQDVIVVRLRDGSHVQRFRIRVSDPFKKLADGFAAKHEIDSSQVTLVFDGLPLALTDTPEIQDMETDDIIDVKMSK